MPENNGKLIPVYVFLQGLGDAVMALAVAKNYYKQTGSVMHIGHKHTEVFLNCEYAVCHPEYAFWELNEQRKKEAEEKGFRLFSLGYFSFRNVCRNYWQYFTVHENLVEMMCRQAGLQGKIELSPQFPLTAEEMEFGKFAEGKIVLISAGVEAYKKEMFRLLGKE